MKKITLSLALALGFCFAANSQTKQGVSATRLANPSHSVQSQYAPQNIPVPTLQSIAGFYEYGFEPTTFPPAGWNRINVTGSNQWARSTAQAHTGAASAYIQYQATAGEDWLIMPKFLVGAVTDSMTFWMRLAYQGYPPDSLSIKVSTTDSLATSFTTTLLKLQEGVNYPPNSTTWIKYKVSLSAYLGQQIYVGFKHYNNNGDGLYIDDVTLGTKPAAEISAVSINMPSTVNQASQIPQATFYNNGSVAQSFNVTMEITPGAYASTMPVTSLAPGSSSTVSFASWLPTSSGSYTLKVYSSLAGDANANNDTLYKTVQVLSSFANNGWTAQTALTSGRWATAPVFVKPCVSSTDTGFVYLIGGGDASFSNTSANSRYNTATGTWSSMAPLPTTVTQITPVAVKNKIYVIGGYTGSFTPTGTNSIYDIAANTWSTGASLPTPVGDYAIGVFGDSLIYVVSGYNGSGDVNNVQIYNVNTNTWTAGTPKTGLGVGGGRMGITGNKIVFAGGYNQTSLSQSAAYLGVIDPANPQNITWTSIAAYPAGTSSRLAAGTSFLPDGKVYFGGGDPDGQGTSARNTVFAYNTLTSQWETGPAMITGASNISAFAGAVHNNISYLITMGGYNGTAVTTSNEWLELTPVPVPYAQADTAICTGSSFTIDAFNGVTYNWSPATGLASTNMASTVASPLATTTYTVSMERGFGCPVVEDVIVTVNSLPVASAGTDAVICDGDNVLLGATGGNMYEWSPATGLSSVSIANPAAGPSSTTTYTVSVTNSTSGCVSYDNVIVSVNALPAVDAGTSTAACAGGSVNLLATGGDSYLWTPATGLNDATIAGPSASPSVTTTYTVTATSTATGCFNSDEVVVMINDLPVVTTSVTGASCFGTSNGSATASVTGSSTYTYSWSTGGSGATESNLAAGTYSVVVTDVVTGCYSQYNVTITQPTALSAIVENDTSSICTGSLTAAITGGIGPFTFLWDDPAVQTLNPATNLCPGNYSVLITDANGCTSNATGAVILAVDVKHIESGITFNVYPNPTSGTIMIQSQFTGQQVNMVLINMMGETIMNIEEGMLNGSYSKSIELSNLANGIYYLQITEGNKLTTVSKIVKQ